MSETNDDDRVHSDEFARSARFEIDGDVLCQYSSMVNDCLEQLITLVRDEPTDRWTRTHVNRLVLCFVRVTEIIGRVSFYLEQHSLVDSQIDRDQLATIGTRLDARWTWLKQKLHRQLVRLVGSASSDNVDTEWRLMRDDITSICTQLQQMFRRSTCLPNHSVGIIGHTEGHFDRHRTLLVENGHISKQ
jgi:hypothetical protein